MKSTLAILLLSFLVASVATADAGNQAPPEGFCVLGDRAALKKFENHEPPLVADFVVQFRKNGSQVGIRQVKSSGVAEFDEVVFGVLKGTKCPGIAKAKGADKVARGTIFPIPFRFVSRDETPR